ncbi:MAG: peptidylprolyl isomerase [Phycisphaerae bacterium]|nr:peptidylprolyl isomerase [Saprospiraceae bacterium]
MRFRILATAYCYSPPPPPPPAEARRAGRLRRVKLLLLLLLPLCACQPPEFNQKKEVQHGKVNLDLRNKKVQLLYNLRDKRNTDSLLLFLNDRDLTLRYLAALSFASVRDTNAIAALAPLLQDPVEDVRVAAAFSLGQIGSAKCEKPLIEAFLSKDSLSEHQRFNAVVLEAVGKCGSRKSLREIAAVTTYQPSDTLLLEGQCRAILRFAMRDSAIIEPLATQRMVEYVGNEKIPASARLVAAYYLARPEGITLDSAQAVTISLGFVRAVNSPEVRAQIALALGNSKASPAFGMLSKVIKSEQDWRVKCEIIKALGKFNYDTSRVLVAEKLYDPNLHVSRAAAEYFVKNGKPQDGDWYYRMARDNPSWPMPMQIALYQAANKNLTFWGDSTAKVDLNWRLKQIFQQSKNPYERAACLAGLAEYGRNYTWIHQFGFNDPASAVKVAATDALVSIMMRPDFWAHFGESAKGVRRTLYNYTREIVANGDPGMIGALAPAFSKKNLLNFRDIRDSTRLEDFRGAFAKLKMPRDYEAIAALEKTIAYLEDRPDPAMPKIPKNHPIDWERMQVVTDQTVVSIQTAKGTIVLELWPQWAPGSVANFIELAGKSFYNGKVFHRVVSDHVIQSGCPRGDGSGALDYSLRTEIGLTWYDQAGLLGMASSGFDTEGTQFFITHSPRVHLDGKYTIFGRVKSGMEVVDKIQQGDVMEKVTVKY